jgi:hypothetical protein
MSTPKADDTRQLWLLPVMSQEFRDGPKVEFERDRLRVNYDYETETGAYKWAVLEFAEVEAFAFTAHESCTEQQVDAYDTLVDVPDSKWIQALEEPRVSRIVGRRHMRIYFDEIGCFEVVATDFEARAAPAE